MDLIKVYGIYFFFYKCNKMVYFIQMGGDNKDGGSAISNLKLCVKKV